MSRTSLCWCAALCVGAALAMTLAAACSARRADPVTGAAVATSPPLVRGERLFAANCSPCHPQGEAGLGPALNDKPLPAFLIALQVRAGVGAMPAFSAGEISDSELDDLLAYVKALRAAR